MKKSLLFVLFAMAFFGINAQTILFEAPIRTTGGTATDTLDNGSIVTFELSTDDAEQENDEVDSYYDDDLDVGWEGDPTDFNTLTVGLRFSDITIPQGAVIDSAFVEVFSHEGKTTQDVAILTIQCEATDNAVTFDETNFNDSTLLTDRPMTSASVVWTCAEDWVIWQQYRTPDLKTVIQEVVNRAGWASGNAIALFLQGENQGPSDFENAREFESFENISDPEDEDPQGNPGDGQNHPERVPNLKIYYKDNTGVAELNADNKMFTVFPNPANGSFNIATSTTQDVQFNIFDVTGKLVQTVQSNGQTTVEVHTNNLDKGVYFVKATLDHHSYSQRVIVY